MDKINFSYPLSSSIYFRYARLILIFRILKISRYFQFMHMIFETVRFTFNEFASIISFFFLFLIFYSLLGRQLNGVLNNLESEQFNTFGASFISVFQVITLDDWFSFLVYEYEKTLYKQYINPLFLLNVVLVGNMIFYNLFATVLLNGFDELNQIIMEGDLAEEPPQANVK
jgi:voltage-gated sodium channel